MLTYGEPAEPRFGAQFWYSLRILQRLTRKVAPIPRPVLPFIALSRGRARVKLWRSESFKSPLEEISDRQAKALARSLDEVSPSLNCEVRTVYEFRRPALDDVFGDLAADPPQRLLLMPMYVVDCDFTSGISGDAVRAYSKRHGPIRPAPEYVGAFSEDERLSELMVDHITEQVATAGWSEADCLESGLLLGAHGTLVEGPPGIDTGLKATQELCDRITDRLRGRFNHVSVGWLNHVRGGVWTSPELADAARSMMDRGLKRVVYFPFGFLADNAETQLEGRLVLREFKELEVLHLPCLNDGPPFIDYLRARVEEKLLGDPASS